MTIKQQTLTEIESRTLTDLIRAEIRQALLSTRCTMPGKVVSFDGTRARVQPLFKTVPAPKMEAISLPEIVDVPVCFPVSSGGASFITIPVKEGDTGTLTFFDRDMARWLYGDGKAVEPESFRIHDLTDASFTPDLQPFKNVTGADLSNTVVKNDKMSITLHPNGQIEISGDSQEMVTVLSSALGNLSNFMTNVKDGIIVVSGSTGGFNPATKTLFTSDISAIDGDKTNLDTMKKV